MIDEVIVTIYKNPNSFTGEDTVEISCHGSTIITQNLIENLLFLGCEPAEPGEFTKRAFLNGKIDLSQAEAVSDLISSESMLSINANYKILRGDFSIKIKKLKKEILNTISLIESELDFSEDEITATTLTQIKSLVVKTINTNKIILKTYKTGKLISDGATIVITGKPNAGKSSLMNILTDSDVYVKNELFATLDSTTKKLELNVNKRSVISDTVGFIQKLPHELVASFRSTLIDIQGSDLILKVVDSSYSNIDMHIKTIDDTIKSIDVDIKNFDGTTNRDIRCGAVAIVLNKNEEALVLKRSDRVATFRGFWNFPAGFEMETNSFGSPSAYLIFARCQLVRAGWQPKSKNNKNLKSGKRV